MVDFKPFLQNIHNGECDEGRVGHGQDGPKDVADAAEPKLGHQKSDEQGYDGRHLLRDAATADFVVNEVGK